MQTTMQSMMHDYRSVASEKKYRAMAKEKIEAVQAEAKMRARMTEAIASRRKKNDNMRDLGGKVDNAEKLQRRAQIDLEEKEKELARAVQR